MGNTKGNIDPNYVSRERKIIGRMVLEKRVMADMDCKQLAEAVGVTVKTITKVETGEFPAEIDLYIKIGIALNFNISFL